MVIVDNTLEAAKHARVAWLIEDEVLSRIEKDKTRDKGDAPGKEIF
jgi:hypothetical protein